MSQQCAMKQIGARSMGYTIGKMEWSNKMDLIAYGNEKGEVIIQRLNWQKIVTFPSLGEDVVVRSLSWQLDETILAVGYSNGKVALLDAERESIISTLSFEGDIHKVYFSRAIKTDDYKNSYRNGSKLTHDFFLPPLPSLSGLSSNSKSLTDHKNFAKGSPCFLVIIMANGAVHLLLLGALKAGTIDLKQHVSHPDEFNIYDARLSGEFNAIYALVRDGNQLKLLHFHNEVLQQYTSPIMHLASHSAHILETRNYINETVQCILEAWETVLLEMDNKLTKYANQQPPGSLSADFMELLVFGYATHEIEGFLIHELTEKGVKKLANSVDLSYSTMQTLVTKPLQSAAVNMFYFLNSTKGLGRMDYFFEPLISFQAAEEALSLCGAFLMKVIELQQVIDQCVNDMKLFFCWLSVLIIRLLQEDIPEDMTQITLENTIYLAEYLNSFEDSVVENADGTVIKRKFNLEKVGQYLENKNLQQISKTDSHHMWRNLIENNECFRNTKLLYAHEKHTSLIQQRDKMFNAIDEVFKKSNESISNSFNLQASIVCCKLPSINSGDIDYIHNSFYINDTTQSDMLVTTVSWQEIIILEFNKTATTMRCTRIDLRPGPFTCNVSSGLENLRCVDLQFYNENIISILLQSSQEKSQSYFLQFQLDATKTKNTLHIMPNNVNLCDVSVPHSVFDFIEELNLRNIDCMSTHLAVSGSRKVASILSDSCRKMSIFEMEIEDDEEDTEISHNSMLEISKGSATSSHE